MSASSSKPRIQQDRRFVNIGALSKQAPRAKVVLVPGAAAPILPLDLPDGLRGSAREKISQRVLQDQVGLTPENVEFRPFDIGASRSDWTHVIAANTEDIKSWRAAAGTACRAVLPDYLALPAAADIWTLSFADGILSARLGLEDGFSSEPDLAILQLKSALGRNAPKAVLPLTPLPPAVKALISQSDMVTLASTKDATRHQLPVPKVLGHGEERFDLRKDPRAARARLRRNVLPWAWPLAFGLVAAALWSAALWLEADKLRQAAQNNREEALGITREVFVPSGPILDIRAQTMSALSDLQSRASAQRQKTSPLDLFAQAIGVTGQQGSILDEMRYDAASGLVANLRLQDFASLDQLVLALGQAGLIATVVRSELDSETREVLAELALRKDTVDEQ